MRRREERDGLKRENTLLEAENQLLRDAVADLEADEGPSFEDGYFTATYEVVQGLPTDFDLQAAFGWSREVILAKTNELVAVSPGDPVGAPQVSNTPGPSGTVQDGADEEEVQDPPIAQGAEIQDVVPPPVVLVVDEESTQVGAGVAEAKDAGGVEGPTETEDPKQDEGAKEHEDA